MSLFQKITTQDQLDFIKNLGLLIKSGKPVNESFGILAKQATSPTLKKELEDAKLKVEKGTSVHEVFEESPHFGTVFVSFVRAGEESGTLEKNLNYLAQWLERNNKLKKEIGSATLYPKIIVTFAVILGAILTVFILPQIVPIFDTLDTQLPITTRILLWISDAVRESGLFLFGGIAVLAVAFWLISKIESVKRIWHQVVFSIPVAGDIAKEYQLTVIAQLIATLFGSGVNINESLGIVSDSVTNISYKEALDKIRERVEKGTGLAEAMTEYPELFPDVFVSVVATGEETGSYGDAFQYLANFFSSRVSEKTQNLPTVLEPALLVVIGIFVAFIASAIIMPIYEVTQGIY